MDERQPIRPSSPQHLDPQIPPLPATHQVLMAAEFSGPVRIQHSIDLNSLGPHNDIVLYRANLTSSQNESDTITINILTDGSADRLDYGSYAQVEGAMEEGTGGAAFNVVAHLFVPIHDGIPGSPLRPEMTIAGRVRLVTNRPTECVIVQVDMEAGSLYFALPVPQIEASELDFMDVDDVAHVQGTFAGLRTREDGGALLTIHPSILPSFTPILIPPFSPEEPHPLPTEDTCLPQRVTSPLPANRDVPPPSIDDIPLADHAPSLLTSSVDHSHSQSRMSENTLSSAPLLSSSITPPDAVSTQTPNQVSRLLQTSLLSWVPKAFGFGIQRGCGDYDPATDGDIEDASSSSSEGHRSLPERPKHRGHLFRFGRRTIPFIPFFHPYAHARRSKHAGAGRGLLPSMSDKAEEGVSEGEPSRGVVRDNDEETDGYRTPTVQPTIPDQTISAGPRSSEVGREEGQMVPGPVPSSSHTLGYPTAEASFLPWVDTHPSLPVEEYISERSVEGEYGLGAMLGGGNKANGYQTPTRPLPIPHLSTLVVPCFSEAGSEAGQSVPRPVPSTSHAIGYPTAEASFIPWDDTLIGLTVGECVSERGVEGEQGLEAVLGDDEEADGLEAVLDDEEADGYWTPAGPSTIPYPSTLAEPCFSEAGSEAEQTVPGPVPSTSYTVGYPPAEASFLPCDDPQPGLTVEECVSERSVEGEYGLGAVLGDDDEVDGYRTPTGRSTILHPSALAEPCFSEAGSEAGQSVPRPVPSTSHAIGYPTAEASFLPWDDTLISLTVEEYVSERGMARDFGLDGEEADGYRTPTGPSTLPHPSTLAEPCFSEAGTDEGQERAEVGSSEGDRTPTQTKGSALIWQDISASPVPRGETGTTMPRITSPVTGQGRSSKPTPPTRPLFLPDDHDEFPPAQPEMCLSEASSLAGTPSHLEEPSTLDPNIIAMRLGLKDAKDYGSLIVSDSRWMVLPRSLTAGVEVEGGKAEVLSDGSPEEMSSSASINGPHHSAHSSHPSPAQTVSPKRQRPPVDVTASQPKRQRSA